MAEKDSSLIQIKVDSNGEVWIRVQRHLANLIREHEPVDDLEAPEDFYRFRVEHLGNVLIRFGVVDPPCDVPIPPLQDDDDD